MSEHYYHKPLMIAYSGGKDSEVLADLAIRSGVHIEFVNNHTTVDAPETVYYIREQFKKWREMGYECTVKYPTYKGKRISMWELILIKRIMPSPWARYCCQVLKEGGAKKRFVATGVRKSESAKRKNRTEFAWVASKQKDAIRKTFEDTAEVYQEDIENSPYGDCRFISAAKHNRQLVANPIIDWSDNDVWEYIHKLHLNYNPLYDKGYTRVGCVGCPLQNYAKKKKDFENYPKYEKLYRKSCQKLYEQQKARGKDFTYKCNGELIAVKNGDEMFDWWMHIRK